MNTITNLLALSAVLLLVISRIVPNRITLLGTPYLVQSGLIGIAILAAIGAAFIPEQPSAPTKPSQDEAPVEVKEYFNHYTGEKFDSACKVFAHFGMSYEQFVTKFNQAALKQNFPLQIGYLHYNGNELYECADYAFDKNRKFAIRLERQRGQELMTKVSIHKLTINSVGDNRGALGAFACMITALEPEQLPQDILKQAGMGNKSGVLSSEQGWPQEIATAKVNYFSNFSKQSYGTLGTNWLMAFEATPRWGPQNDPQ